MGSDKFRIKDRTRILIMRGYAINTQLKSISSTAAMTEESL